MLTINEIKLRLAQADEKEFKILERSLCADTRKGVQNALNAAQKRLEAAKQEQIRLAGLYDFENEIADGKLIVGLDEVGRGPLAGPLAVGAVVLSRGKQIPGLNDSKKIPEAARKEIAEAIKDNARAWSVQYIDADHIDAAGMSVSLRMAFSRAIKDIESQGVVPDVVLIDGNPLHLDKREINIIKGDMKCASIAAASIIAKVARDERMIEYAKTYPLYGFEKSKGYASAEHIEAIKTYGLCDIHRQSFCTNFLQQSLF